MGNVKPKLSQALQREFDVRRQLGIGTSYAKAKGRRGAKRAEKELQRREAVKRRRNIGWNDLCFELQGMILNRLSLLDLANVREAGLGAVSILSKMRMRDMMLRRCKQLTPLWMIWTRGTPNYQTKADRLGCRPVEFSSIVSKLCVSPDSGGIPDSICEMTALRYLDISRKHHSAFLVLPPALPSALTTLPASLAACQGLFELKMSHHNFKTIPECVLSLRNLRRFEMEHNRLLTHLPDDMGDRLPKLRFVSIRGCKNVKKLPDSLLLRLEMSIKTRERHRIPLLLTGRYFPDGYLATTIVEEKYPNLATYLRNGSLGAMEHNLWGAVEDFVDVPQEAF